MPEQQTVVITGAAGHLGQAVAATFRQRGARLVLMDQQAERLHSLFGDWSDAYALPVDLLVAEDVAQGLGQAVQRFGRLDALCHIAGGFRMGEAVHQTSAPAWDFLMDVNARSLMHVARALVPHLIERRGFRLVALGAAAAGRGAAHMGAYCASKSALIRLTEAMSAELKDQHVNVNCVLPSIIDTPDNRLAMPQADPGRWVAPAELADVIAFLCSDAARAIHGAAIPVSGLV